MVAVKYINVIHSGVSHIFVTIELYILGIPLKVNLLSICSQFNRNSISSRWHHNLK